MVGAVICGSLRIVGITVVCWRDGADSVNLATRIGPPSKLLCSLILALEDGGDRHLTEAEVNVGFDNASSVDA